MIAVLGIVFTFTYMHVFLAMCLYTSLYRCIMCSKNVAGIGLDNIRGAAGGENFLCGHGSAEL